MRGKIGNCKFKTGEKNGGMDHRRTQSSRVQLMDMKFVPGCDIIQVRSFVISSQTQHLKTIGKEGF